MGYWPYQTALSKSWIAFSVQCMIFPLTAITKLLTGNSAFERLVLQTEFFNTRMIADNDKMLVYRSMPTRYGRDPFFNLPNNG